MRISEDDVANAWGGFKNFMGDVWHHGTKVLGTIDRIGNLGLRLMGAASHTGMLQGRALESGIKAARSYDHVRGEAERFGSRVSKTVDHFRTVAPELNI